MDANARVGSHRDVNDYCEPVGPFQPQRATWAGVQLTTLLREHRLALANTWVPSSSGPTWTDGTTLSRIDYIALPKSYLPNIMHMEVAYEDARLLQACSCVNWRDHAPLKLSLLYGDWHPGQPGTQPKPTIWNRVQMVTALSSPRLAAPFRRDLEEWAGTPL
eukprot:5019075-Heterocapsa_arctica.AAC.1